MYFFLLLSIAVINFIILPEERICFRDLFSWFRGVIYGTIVCGLFWVIGQLYQPDSVTLFSQILEIFFNRYSPVLALIVYLIIYDVRKSSSLSVLYLMGGYFVVLSLSVYVQTAGRPFISEIFIFPVFLSFMYMLLYRFIRAEKETLLKKCLYYILMILQPVLGILLGEVALEEYRLISFAAVFLYVTAVVYYYYDLNKLILKKQI